MGHKIIKFVKEDIWMLDDNGLSYAKGMLVQSLKIAVLSAQGFSRDVCALRASALSLYRLLSIVPIFAFLFGVVKGIGFEIMLE
jgi:membrane protein